MGITFVVAIRILQDYLKKSDKNIWIVWYCLYFSSAKTVYDIPKNDRFSHLF